MYVFATMQNSVFDITKVAKFNGAEFIVVLLVYIFDVTQVAIRSTKVRVHLAARLVLMIMRVGK